MTTRLTNNMRDEIIESAMKGTTYEAQKKAILVELQARAKAHILQCQPPEFLKLVKGKPKEWFQLQTDVYLGDLRAELPALRAQCYRIGLDDPLPYAVFAKAIPTFVISLKDLEARMAALSEQHEQARGTLSTFLKSCSTVEKVLERMPELAPHAKFAAKSYPLVAPSNALAMLAKLGFDQSVKK